MYNILWKFQIPTGFENYFWLGTFKGGFEIIQYLHVFNNLGPILEAMTHKYLNKLNVIEQYFSWVIENNI